MLKKNKVNLYISINKNQNLKGGGFNFLNYLEYKLRKKKNISKSLAESKIILINSHHNFLKNFFIKLFFPSKLFVHRIDGPISKYAGKNDYRDYLVKLLNFYIADATIFQSNWSFKKKKFRSTKNFIIIHNTADKRFYNYKKIKKIKNSIVISSWSNNINKGFKYYSFLDKNLNFNKYSVSFVGNSPVKFKNIKIYKPLDSKKLAKLMLKHQVYISASKNDPCSNSLIEALELKLPSIVLNSGGHTELLNKRGLYFINQKDLLYKINLIFKNYNIFLKRFKKNDIDIVNKYSDYFEFILNKFAKNDLNIKNINLFVLIRVIILYLFITLKSKN